LILVPYILFQRAYVFYLMQDSAKAAAEIQAKVLLEALGDQPCMLARAGTDMETAAAVSFVESAPLMVALSNLPSVTMLAELSYAGSTSV